MRVLIPLLVLAAMVSCSCVAAQPTQSSATQGEDSTKARTKKVLDLGTGMRFGKGLAFSVAGAVPMPQERFGQSYDESYGYSAGFGFWFATLPDTGVTSEWLLSGNRPERRYLEISRDMVDLNDAVAEKFGVKPGATASILSIHFSGSQCVPISLPHGLSLAPVWGHKVGVSWFSIDEDDYNQFGHTTLTELKHENNRGQLGTGRQLGVLLTGFDPFSVQYSYDLMSAERTWKFGHGLVSALCSGLLIDGVTQLGRALLSPEAQPSTAVEVILMAYQAAASYYWYDYTYKHNNWPFKDEPPLRYQRHVLALHYKF
jgi:hypothetical protein